MFLLLVINFITIIKARRGFACSSSATLTSSVTEQRGNDGPTLYRTTIRIQIRQDETVCFEVGEEGEEIGSGTRYALTMRNHGAKYRYKDMYEFGIPEVRAECTCQCSKVLEDVCDTKTDMCKDKVNCKSNFYTGQSAKGCIGIGVTSSSICCAVHYSNPEQIWQAVELEKHGDIAVIGIREGYTEEPYTTVKTEVYIGTPTSISNFDITISNSRPPKLLQTQWYYGHADKQDLFEATKGLNSKNSFQVKKLGWLKYNRTLKKFDPAADWGDEFHLDTKNKFDCGDNEFSSQFGGISPREEEQTRQPIEEKNKDTIEHVIRDDESRLVTFDYVESTIVLTLDIVLKKSGKLPVAQYSDDSTLQSIQAEIFIDAHNSRFVKFIISGGGTIKGTIQDLTKPKIEEMFALNIPIGKNITRLVKLKDLVCTKQSQIKICAYPKLRDGQKEHEQLCIDNVKCNLEQIPGFYLPNNTIETIGSEKMSLLSTKYWLRYLNPLEWFNGISGWQEGLMLFVEVAGVLGLIGLVIKLARVMGCLGKCCSFMFCCCLCPKTKKKFNDKRRYTKRRMTESFSVVKKKLAITMSQVEKDLQNQMVRNPTIVLSRMTRLGWKRDVDTDRATDEEVAIVDAELQNVDTVPGKVVQNVDLERNKKDIITAV